MKYQVTKYPDGRYRCVRQADGEFIRLTTTVYWLQLDPKSAEPYFDHEFAKKTTINKVK